jgi:hypothetical protein
MKLALLVLLAACSSKSGPVDCEALKTKYLAQTEVKMINALGGVESGAGREAIVAEGQKELGMAEQRFIGVCRDLGDKMDGACFDAGGDERERKKRCHDLEKELDHMLYRQ